jgi:hypothetical protein
MKKSSPEMKLSVALTKYGWALDSHLGSNEERLGLFVTQGQAVASAKKHMRVVKSQGIRGTLTVTGNEVDTGRRKILPFARLR